MVKSFTQCVDIQAKRIANGKRGYAKAVIRFLKRCNYGHVGEDKKRLPVFWG